MSIEIKGLETVQEVMSHLGLENKELKNLYDPMAYIMDLGGKRLRPLVLLLSYQAYKPNGSVEAVAPAMRAIELFHNFTLLHDDVMDDAPMRRGKPSVYKKWGTNTAILSGDGMLIEAYKHLAQLSPEKLPHALDIFNDMGSAVCEGQQYDMDFEQLPLSQMSMSDYLGMIRLKTSYLFCGAASLGAYLADAPETDRKLLWEAIEKMGLAFQIKDDYLDIYSKPSFGKVQGGDILEGKRTWLLLSAYAKDSKEVLAALDLKDDEQKIARMTQLYSDLGIRDAALEEVERQSKEATKILDQLSVAEENIEPLRQLFLTLVRREV